MHEYTKKATVKTNNVKSAANNEILSTFCKYNSTVLSVVLQPLFFKYRIIPYSTRIKNTKIITNNNHVAKEEIVWDLGEIVVP